MGIGNDFEPVSTSVKATDFMAIEIETTTGVPAGTTSAIVAPQGANKMYVLIGTLASCTFTPYISIDGSNWFILEYDIDGRTYPATTFTGGRYATFIIPPCGEVVDIAFTSSEDQNGADVQVSFSG